MPLRNRRTAEVPSSLAERLLPGLHAASPDPQTARDLAIAVVRAHCPTEPMIAMLFGSYAQGRSHRLSDLDVIVVPTGAPDCTPICSKTTFLHSGMPFEIASYTLDALYGLIAQAPKSGALDLPHVVATSALLIGDARLHDDLVAAARTALACAGPVLDARARLQMRWRATSMLLKFLASRDHYEQIMIGGRLVQLLAFLLLRFETGWSFSRPDYALTALCDHDPAAAEVLSVAYAALVDGNGPDRLAEAAEDGLNQLGGACWDGVVEPVAGPIRGVPG